MNKFEELKAELMKESLEDLLEQVFSGSCDSGPTRVAIREKIKELRSAPLEQISKETILRIVDACFHAFASEYRSEAREMAEGLLA